MNERAQIEQRIASADKELRLSEQVAERLSWARVLYLVAAVAFLTWARLGSWPWILGAIVVFVLLVRVHRRSVDRAERARGALAAARGALARMDRDWMGMPPLQALDLSGVENRAAIRDLDVYGDRSLYRLVDVGQPSVGGVALIRWLLGDAESLTAIHERQASVQSLRARPDFIFESARLCRHGARPGPSGAKLAAFKRWCEEPGKKFSPVLVGVARFLTLAFAVVVAAMIVRPELRQPAGSLLICLIAAQFLVASLARRYLRARVGNVADILPELTGVTDIIRAIAAQPVVEGRFGEIQRRLAGEGAAQAFTRLSRLFGWDAVHHSPMLHAAVNAVVAFDAHLASRIDRWQAEFGPRLPGWIDLVGEAQALTALATLAYENPGWAMPTVADGELPTLTAGECGHPLIANDTRVANPVSLDAPGSVIVISGSNMSGKTTYLRAVGLNTLLALAGGPVCATRLTMRRCRVRTTVRVEDDLAAGVSLFLAEVSRIRDIVADAADDRKAPVLFLLDEILHGTNAPDRRQASQLVLKRLLATGSSGIITTHDAGIADFSGPTNGSVKHAHFTDALASEQGEVTMTFDYVIRPGPATTTNALRILEALGLSAS